MEQMHKSAVDFNTFPTAELVQLLHKDCDGTGTLSVGDVLAISEILARRQPVSRSAQAAWQQFLRCYVPRKNANTER